MNPTTSSALDPKLKEVYDRVMGTSLPKPSTGTAPSQPSASTPKPPTVISAPPSQETSPGTAAPISTPIPSTQPASPQPNTFPPPKAAAVTGATQNTSAIDYASLAAKYATPPATPEASNSVVQSTPVVPSTTTYGVVNNSQNTQTTPNVTPFAPEEKNKSLKKLLLIGGIMLFFAFYTVVWVIIFGVKMPF